MDRLSEAADKEPDAAEALEALKRRGFRRC